MQRLRIFLLILAITFSVLVILASISWYLSVSAPSYYRSSWIGQMWGSVTGNSYGGMGGMMGNGGSANSSYYWVIPVALIATVAVAIIGVSFYLVFPQLGYIKGEQCNPEKIEPNPKSSQDHDSCSGDRVIHCQQRFRRSEQLRCAFENDDRGRAEGFQCSNGAPRKIPSKIHS